MNIKEQIAALIDQLPASAPHASIGIGITEHNRYDVFKKSYDEIVRFAPPGSRIVVVDDASKIPVPEATFRFEQNVGIAAAKNKCFELLMDCEHIFLFDSDTYPIKEDWWKPYVESPEPHLNYIFKDFATGSKLNDTQVVYRDSQHIAYSHVRGCMMYYHRSVMDKVGGMDPIFGKWGYEHPDLSNRIFMAGLTSFRYMDVVGSEKLIHSGDEHRQVQTTVGGIERQKMIAQNKAIYDSRIFISQFVPFIQKKNLLITCYFTGVPDPQRKASWKPDIDQLMPLINSLKQTNLVVLHDCFGEVDVPGVEFVRVDTSLNPYIQRWISIRRYLMENHNTIQNVFCIDATDVEVLREPDWNNMGDHIYTGDENELLHSDWMLNRHKPFDSFIRENGGLQLLNAGILGGNADIVCEFIRQMVDCYALTQSMGDTDMGLFNYIARSNWKERIMSGRQVCTLFKGFEKNNKVSWFKHK